VAKQSNGSKTGIGSNTTFASTRSGSLFKATLSAIIVSALLTVGILVFAGPFTDMFRSRWLLPQLPSDWWHFENWFAHETRSGLTVIVLPWSVLITGFLVAGFVRRWLLTFVGDLAVYLSAHRASKFDQIRDEIKERACEVLRSIYMAEDEGGNALYPEVIVVGHSLGSVIAYDALNTVIRDRELHPSKFPEGSVATRTRLFLTAGSPLNTTAFLFRVQADAQSTIREMLAASVQPVILSDDFRPRKWLNIWTPMDPISAELSFYNGPKDANGQPAIGSNPFIVDVENLCDELGNSPFISHSNYFDNPMLREALVGSVREWADRPRGISSRTCEVPQVQSLARPLTYAICFGLAALLFSKLRRTGK
jgi:hypothetical protein